MDNQKRIGYFKRSEDGEVSFIDDVNGNFIMTSIKPINNDFSFQVVDPINSELETIKNNLKPFDMKKDHIRNFYQNILKEKESNQEGYIHLKEKRNRLKAKSKLNITKYRRS